MEQYKTARKRLIREALELGWEVVTTRAGHTLANPRIRPPSLERLNEQWAHLGPRTVKTGESLALAVSSGLDMRGLSIATIKTALEE